MRVRSLVTTLAILVALSGGASPVQAKPRPPTTAAGFTQLFADKNDRTWSGGDQMTSFRAPNRKIYWISGDTMLSDGEDPDGSYPDEGTVMVSNRILLQDGANLTNAMANDDIAVPDPPSHPPQNQERYWPQGTFAANGFLYVLCQRVMKHPDPANELGFQPIGVELAKFAFGAGGSLTLTGMLPTPASGVVAGAGPALTQWAGDAIVHNGHVYVYGYTLAKGNPFVAHFSYLARVPEAQVEDPTAWRYFKKTTGRWVTSTAELSADLASQPDSILASQVASVRVIAGKVVVVHKPWNGYGSAVYAEVGTDPQGPFVRKFLFDSPAGTWEGKNYITYGPMLHPEQTLKGAEKGAVLVSVDWNGKDFWTDTLGNADLYKPRFHPVTLP